jgi:hypothetical protein
MTSRLLPFRLRPFGQHNSEQDYQLLHALSNYQAPQDPAGNSEWLASRRAYDQQRGKRRHYIAVHVPTEASIAYAALEQQGPDLTSFRIYLVFDPQRWSFNKLGEFLYQQLLTDATASRQPSLCVLNLPTMPRFSRSLKHTDLAASVRQSITALRLPDTRSC